MFIASKVTIIASCWFSISVIASVKMIMFADRLGDIFFGYFCQLVPWFL